MNKALLKNPEVSVIILTHNNLAFTRLCLDSVCSSTDGTSYEVIVVDNASDDQTPQFLESFTRKHENVKLVFSQQNLTITKGFNIGVSQSTGEILVFLNSDTVVTQGWLAGLLKPLRGISTGMVAPTMNECSGECRIKVTYEDLPDMHAFAERYTTSHKGETFEVRSMDMTCTAIRRMVYEEVGTFDERFNIGMFVGEDYGRRLLQKGYKLLCIKEAYVHHWYNKEINQLGFDEYWKRFKVNRARYENKWRTRWVPPSYRDEYLDDQLRYEINERIKLTDIIIEQKGEIARLKRLLESTYSSKGWKMLTALRRLHLPDKITRAKLYTSTFNLLGKPVSSYNRYLGARREKQAHASLSRILDRHLDAHDIYIFAPSVSWQVPLFQRPHQLALALARQGNLVFFLEPSYSNVFPSAFMNIEDQLYVVSHTPFDIFKSLSSPIVFTIAYNVADLSHLDNSRIIYEYIDELELFPGDPVELHKSHNEMLISADIVIATADRLLHKLTPFREDALLVPNAVDFPFIRSVIEKTQEPPVELQPFIEQRKPIIGYYGALAEWFDYGLLYKTAQNRPNYQFILIGPDYDGSYQSSLLEELVNVHWLGIKPYIELPRYLKYFDVATIPFLLNEITHSTSPLKLFEYMTGGKPIVTTAMHECKKYPVVQIGHDDEEYMRMLDIALELKQDKDYIQELIKTARENSWDQRATQIINALEILGKNTANNKA